MVATSPSIAKRARRHQIAMVGGFCATMLIAGVFPFNERSLLRNSGAFAAFAATPATPRGTAQVILGPYGSTPGLLGAAPGPRAIVPIAAAPAVLGVPPLADQPVVGAGFPVEGAPLTAGAMPPEQVAGNALPPIPGYFPSNRNVPGGFVGTPTGGSTSSGGTSSGGATSSGGTSTGGTSTGGDTSTGGTSTGGTATGGDTSTGGTSTGGTTTSTGGDTSTGGTSTGGTTSTGGDTSSGSTGGSSGGTTPPVGAVPEPATWLMMLGGFFAVGFALRRRRINRSVGCPTAS